MDDSSTSASPQPNELTAALSNLLDIEARRLLLLLHTGEPCTVTAYKPPTPPAPPVNGLPARVNVSLGHIRTRRENLPDGTTMVVPMGTNPTGVTEVKDCPVIFPSLSSSFMMLPDTAGVSLLGNWGYLTGNSRYPAPTMTVGVPSISHLTETRHSINNGFFVPGLFPGTLYPNFSGSEPNKIKLGDMNGLWSLSYDLVTQAVKLETKGPTLTIDSTGVVQVGGNAVESLIKQTFIGVMDAMISAAIVGSIPQDGGTAAFTAFQIAWNNAKSTILTTKAKGE